ncbi:MAG TPA: hypothetical protein VF057_05785 [Thermoanaerobaculia bacterium]
MKLVRDRADAYWLPQRFRFALFRLLAYAMFRSMGRQDKSGIVLGIDRDQSAIEHYSVAIWVTVVSTLFAYGALAKVLIRPAAALLAPIVSTVLLQAMVVSPVVLPRPSRWINRVDFISFLTLFAVISGAIYFATQTGWLRYVAWSVFALVAFNAVAAVILALMKISILAATEDVVT